MGDLSVFEKCSAFLIPTRKHYGAVEENLVGAVVITECVSLAADVECFCKFHCDDLSFIVLIITYFPQFVNSFFKIFWDFFTEQMFGSWLNFFYFSALKREIWGHLDFNALPR